MKDLNLLTCEFFGLPSTEDPFQLLGLSVHTPDADSVKKALRKRLHQWLVHPRTNRDEANTVKQHLTEITDALLHAIPESQSLIRKKEVEMTPLDRSIIATLISMGGWNSKSRARLAAIAALNSITVGGLMRILEALGEAARDGEGPLSAQRRNKLAIDRTWVTVPSKQSKLSVAENFVSDLAEKLTPDLRNPSPVLTVKIAVFFGLLTVLAFVLSLQVLLSPENEKTSNELPSHFGETVEHEETAIDAPRLFDEYPTFSIPNIGNQYATFADKLHETSRKLSVLEESISDSLQRNQNASPAWILTWEEVIASISNGWVLAEPRELQQLQDKIIQVLLASQGYSGLSDSFLSLLELPPLQTVNPSRLPEIVWRSGMLARISCEQTLSMAVRSTARALQFSESDICDVAQVRASALFLLSEKLAERTIFDDGYLYLWETWLLTVNSTNEEQVKDTLLLSAIQDLLHVEIDITRQTNNRKVLGRLVKELHWARSASTKRDVLSMYSDASLDADDLYLLSQLLMKSGRATWFTEAYAVTSRDSLEDRFQLAAKLRGGWPLEATPETKPWALGIPVGFDEHIYDMWMDVYSALGTLDATSPSAIADYRFLNEMAVYIWKDRADLAIQKMESRIQVDFAISNRNSSRMPAIDGKWSEEFRKSSAKEKRLELIDELRDADYDTLGPIDSSRLASAAFTNFFSSIRDAATELIVDSFSKSGHVSVALVASYDAAVSPKQIARIVAQLTEAILPEPDSANWTAEARRALVQHALTVDNSATFTLDVAAVELAQSYMAEYLLLRPSALPPSNEVSPLEAIQATIEAWEDGTVRAFLMSSTVEYKSAGIMQSFLYHQLSYLKLLQIDEARWRGRDFVDKPVPVGLDGMRSNSAIDMQILAAEQLIAEHWYQIFMDLNTETQKLETE
jgi:hypothetical protein